MGGGLLSKLGAGAGLAGVGGLGALVGGGTGFAAPVPVSNQTGNQAGTSVMNPQDTLLNQTLSTLLTQAVRNGNMAAVPGMGGAASAAGSELGAVQSLMPQLINANKAQTAEENVANLLAQAGGAQGAPMGALSRLEQTFTGGPAGLLPGQNKLGAAESNLSGLLGGNAPAMPSVTSSQGTAQTALQGIQALIQSMYGGNANVNMAPNVTVPTT
jgi:hypothetical protein